MAQVHNMFCPGRMGNMAVSKVAQQPTVAETEVGRHLEINHKEILIETWNLNMKNIYISGL